MEIIFVYSESCTNIERARGVFQEMRDAGANAVIICVYEQDLLRWSRDMVRLFEAAADAGLRRYVSYGRTGNVFSGLMMTPSLFAYTHPETLVVTEQSTHAEAGSSHSRFWSQVCCVNHPRFREFMEEQTQTILERFHPEGLLFDEPKGLSLVCSCEYCRLAQGAGQSAQESNVVSQVGFIESLCDQAKAHNDQITTMIVTGHHDDAVLANFAEIENLDVLGAEAYWVSRRMSLDDLLLWCSPTVEKLKNYGKRTQIWAQNFSLPFEHIEDLKEALGIMAAAEPDQLCSFWWWRENDDPERVMAITSQTLGRIAAGQNTYALS